MEKRTHSHLYRYAPENPADSAYDFVEAITFENWRNENEQSYNFILLKYEYDCNEEDSDDNLLCVDILVFSSMDVIAASITTRTRLSHLTIPNISIRDRISQIIK